MHGFEKVQRAKFFILESEVHDYPIRVNELRIWPPDTKTRRRRKFFDLRIIKEWNDLPGTVAKSESISCFKTGLDRHINSTRGGTFERA